MHIWFDLLSREALMGALLGAFGAWPAALLPKTFDGWARVAMAPVLGLCVGTCVFTTLLWFFPATATAWVVPAIAVLSLAAAPWRLRHARDGRHSPDASVERSLGWRSSKRSPARFIAVGALELVTVAAAATLPYLLTLHQRQSVGPASYQVYDTLGYVAVADGAEHQSFHAASVALDANPSRYAIDNFVRIFWEDYARGFQEIAAEPISANVNAITGLGGTDTQAPFLVAFLVSGALAMYAVIRRTTRKAGWAAVLGGSLFGGAFFLQLYFDGSEAAICGLAILVPFFVIGWETIRRPSRTNVFLSAVLGSGLVACYPIFVPEVAIIGLASLLVLWIRRAVRGRAPSFPEIGRAAVALLAFTAGITLLDVVAFRRAFLYWRSILHGQFGAAQNFPNYKLGPGVVAGWIAQTRYFYDLAFAHHSFVSNLLLGTLAPLALALVAVAGALWRRVGLVVLSLIAIGAGLGAYQALHRGCSYCEDRTLLPLEPSTIFLVCVGLAALASMATIWTRGKARPGRAKRFPAKGQSLHLGLTASLVMALLASIGYTAYRARSDIEKNVFVIAAQERLLLARLPQGATVDLEGFNEGGQAPGEQVLTYELADEMTNGHVSLAGDSNDNSAMAYLGTQPVNGPQFDPSYTYVFSRVFGIHTNRVLVAAADGVGLQRRSSALDVTLDYGAVVPSHPSDNPLGQAWVNPDGNEPLDFIVSGGSAAVPAFVDIRLVASASTIQVHSPTLHGESRNGGSIDLCLEAVGMAPVRTAQVWVTPGAGVLVYSMAAAQGRCAAPPP